MWIVYQAQQLPEGYAWGETVDREPAPLPEPWPAGILEEGPNPSISNPPAAKVVERPRLRFIERVMPGNKKTILVALSSEPSLEVRLEQIKDRFENEEGHRPPGTGN